MSYIRFIILFWCIIGLTNCKSAKKKEIQKAVVQSKFEQQTKDNQDVLDKELSFLEADFGTTSTTQKDTSTQEIKMDSAQVMAYLQELLAVHTSSEDDPAKKRNPIQNYKASATRLTDLIHTDLEVSLDYEKCYLYGKAILALQPYYYTTDSLVLDAKGMDIKEISILKNTTKIALKYTYDSRKLHIKLDKNYKRNEQYKIYIEYTAKPNELKVQGSSAITGAKGLYFINPAQKEEDKPTQVWTQGETEASSCWFPTIDKSNEKMTHDIYITVEDKYVTLSNGLLKSSKKNGNMRTDHWKMDMPNSPYLVMMAIGEYAIVKDKWRNIEVNYYVEKEYEKYAKNIFGNTPEMLEFFSKTLRVDYPWQKYHQIVVRDYVSGAMENTGAVIFMEALQQTDREQLDKNYESTIAHELFHHWFGDLVTCESWANLPLNESFANYAEYLWFENKYGRDEADAHLQEELGGYLAESKWKNHDLIHYYYTNKEDMFDGHSYNKGGAVLHMLRKYLGDEAFFDGLKEYLTTNKFQPAEIHHLRLAFEKVTGEDLNWFFNQWFLDKGQPVLNITKTYDATNKTVTIQVEQKQDLKDRPIYKLPLNIAIYESSTPRIEKIVIDQVKQSFVFSNVNNTPQWIDFDTENALLAEMTEDNTATNWEFVYQKAPLYQDRYDAIQHLSPYKNAEMYIKTFSDKHWAIVETALDVYKNDKELNRINQEDATAYKNKIVQIAMNHPKSAVREKALSIALEQYGKDIELKNKLITHALQDKSYAVMGKALAVGAKEDFKKYQPTIEKLEQESSIKIFDQVANIYLENKVTGKYDYMYRFASSGKSASQRGTAAYYLGAYTNKLTDEPSHKKKTLDLATKNYYTEGVAWIRLEYIKTVGEIMKFYKKQGQAMEVENIKTSLKDLRTKESRGANQKAIENLLAE